MLENLPNFPYLGVTMFLRLWNIPGKSDGFGFMNCMFPGIEQSGLMFVGGTFNFTDKYL